MNPEPIILAVDPGANGGVAWFEPGKGVQAVKMPETDLEKLALFKRICEGIPASLPHGSGWPKTIALIERVGGYVRPPKKGRPCPMCGGGIPDSTCSACHGEGVIGSGGQPGSAMFSFGENAGIVRGMLLALGAKVERVDPRTWQQPLFLPKAKTMPKPEWKRTLKARAQRRFPGIKVTLNTADSLLILAWGALRYGDPQTEGKRATGHPSAVGEAISAPREEQCVRCGRMVTEWVDPDWSKGRVCLPCQSRCAPPPSVFPSTGENSDPPFGHLYVGDWRGTPFVFRRTPAGQTFLVRKATDADLLNLPRKGQVPA